MRVVLDTNVLISAMMVSGSLPGKIIASWRRERFTLLTCEEHLDELRRATRYPQVRSRIKPSVAGRLINEIGKIGIHVPDLPSLELSKDLWDNYLLALAQAGSADYLVTGDKADLLALGKFGPTRIVSVREFAVALLA